MGEAATSPDAATSIAQADALVASGAIRDAIDLLTSANRSCRSSDIEQALVRVRHVGCASLPPPIPPVGRQPLVATAPSAEIVEVAAADLTASVVRAGFARSGCVLVRGLLSSERVAPLVAGIDATFAAFDRAAADDAFDPEWYEPFPMPDVVSPANAGAAVALAPGAPSAGRIPARAHRRVTREAAGIWTVDSPRMLFEFFELIDEIGMGDLITEYLGERPFLSANKCALRRVPVQDMSGGWHQDGAFLGEDVAAFNCWIALTRCGVDAPGLDIVPRRFDHLLEAGSKDAYFKWSLSDDDVRIAADGVPLARPVFQAGDALLFDHRLAHRTATSPTMTMERHAIEAWFFAPSAFPPSQLPIVY